MINPHKRKTKIGFSLSRGGGGPSTFMKRMMESIVKQKLANTAYFYNPFTDINIYANIVRNPWNKPYVFRVDGITFDSELATEETNRRNQPIFDGIDHAAGIVFQAAFCLELVSQFHGKPSTPYTIINNGVNLEEFSPKGSNRREHLGIGENELVFITSAKWRAHKRLNSIIDVFNSFQKVTGQQAHLVILGALDQPVPNAQNIHIVGHVSPEDLAPWYRTGDICLFFSWLDHCPNTVVESLACGVPVICTNQGGTRELIEKTKGGIVVDADAPFQFKPVDLYHPPAPDQNALVKAVITMVDRRKEFAAAIDRTAIDIDVVAQRYVDFVEKVYRKQL